MDLAVLKTDFQLDWNLGLSRLAVAPFVLAPSGPALTYITPAPPEESHGGPAFKKFRPSEGVASSRPAAAGGALPGPSGEPKGQGKGKAPQGKSTDKQQNMNVMISELTGMMGRQSPTDVQRYIDAKFAGNETDRRAIGTIMSTYCRHCLRNSRAVVKHPLATCKAMGKQPSTACPKCARLGITEYHWPDKCSN